MGLADRDYMKPKFKPNHRPPGFWLRVKFWLWRIFKGGK